MGVNNLPRGKPGPGRPKGSANKVTSDVRKMVLAALDGVGGQKYLEDQAVKNPVAFLSLLGRLIPTKIIGDPAEPVTIDGHVARDICQEIRIAIDFEAIREARLRLEAPSVGALIGQTPTTTTKEYPR